MDIDQAWQQDTATGINLYDFAGHLRQGTGTDLRYPAIQNEDMTVGLKTVGRRVEQRCIGDEIALWRAAIWAHGRGQMMSADDEASRSQDKKQPEGDEKSKHVCLPRFDGSTGSRTGGRIARYPDSGRAEFVSAVQARIWHPEPHRQSSP
ncbi:hypothetical protein MACH15_23370 [Maricaulis maris]|nr:hypothetical protein MACH15_23370 [Maricaulis maris]